MKNPKQLFVLFAPVLGTLLARGQANSVYAWRNFVGQPGGEGNVDGAGSTARFWGPSGAAVDSAGNVYVADNTGNMYVADTENNRISKGTPLPTMTAWQSGSSVMVSWPSPSTGFVPQTNASVGNAAGWTDCGDSISDDGTNKSITVSSPAGTLFFRLRSN
jgi:hypothetical protein